MLSNILQITTDIANFDKFTFKLFPTNIFKNSCIRYIYEKNYPCYYTPITFIFIYFYIFGQDN